MGNSKRILAVLLLGLSLTSLAACGRHSGSAKIMIEMDIQMDHGMLVLRAEGHPVAHVDAAGDFDIGGQPVAVDATQRAQFARYYQQVQGIQRSGIAVGKAGAAMAGSVVGDVLGNLFSGHEDSIGAEARRQADGLKARAEVLCRQVQDLRTTQDAIAASLPAFRPYATIRADAAHDCRGDLHDKH